jgi:hypothetical protein
VEAHRIKHCCLHFFGTPWPVLFLNATNTIPYSLFPCVQFIFLAKQNWSAALNVSVVQQKRYRGNNWSAALNVSATECVRYWPFGK